MGLKNCVLALVAGSVLAGCAAPRTSGVQPEDLRNSVNFVTETLIGDIDFPALQRNLFQHRAACGWAPRFVMKERQTGYANLFETDEIPESFENTILVDLVQYPESWRSPKRVEIRVYSYYYNDDVQKRVDRILSAVRQPGVCVP